MIERYYLKEMKQIWSEENYYEKWKEVEMAVLRVRGEDELAEKIKNVRISPEEVRKRESHSGHELNSFLSLLEDKIKDGAGKIHKGLTSSDIMDTARLLQIKESIEIIESILEENIKILKEKALEYKNLIMCGRTHGQFAEPITLGLKFAKFLEAGRRNAARIKEMKKRIFVGKISGAVGTYSLISPAEEKEVLAKLGLKPLNITSQVVPRDIFAEYVFTLALISAFGEEIALEIRLLSQDGIKEVSEPFSINQTGSSAMPHKKNPVTCEKISGLARLVRSYVQVALSNIALWNERDISHSSNERIILEEVSSLTYYILDRLRFVLKDIVVHFENIKKNLDSAGLKLFSSGILKMLLSGTLSRKVAYGIARDIFKSGGSVKEIVDTLRKHTDFDETQIKEALNFKYYLGYVDEIFKRLDV